MQSLKAHTELKREVIFEHPLTLRQEARTYTMKLIHLGAFYTPSTQTIDTVKTDTELSFLGRRFNMRIAKTVAQPPLTRQLIYRGDSYKA